MSLALRVINGGLNETAPLSSSVFNEQEMPDEYWKALDAEQAAWTELDRQREETSCKLAQRAIHELMARQASPRKKGRPGTLPAYKEYQREFLKRWAAVIERRSGEKQVELALLFNLDYGKEGECASHWRQVKLGTALRLGYRRFSGVSNKIVREKGWHRNKSLVSLWLYEPYMSEAEFIDWARKRALKLA